MKNSKWTIKEVLKAREAAIKQQEVEEELRKVVKWEKLKLECLELKKDLEDQIMLLKGDVPPYHGKRGKHPHPLLEQHKYKIKRNRFWRDPVKEIRELDKMQEKHRGEFTQADFTYMAKRRKIAIRNTNNPTARFRAVGSKMGFLTPEEQQRVEFYKIQDEIYKVLDEFQRKETERDRRMEV